MNKSLPLLVLALLLNSILIAQHTTRTAAKQDYDTNYTPSSFTNADLAWTGSVATCTPGTVSQTVHNRIVQRMNYFRRMVGLQDQVVLDATLNAKCQQAALIMEANNTLTHFPPMNSLCWTADGNEGAGSSNLNWGSNDFFNPINSYIEDPGTGNYFVGHRRWILYSKGKTYGNGITPNRQALWTFANGGNPTVFNNFIAYPPAGYIPNSLAFPRWSFSHPTGNFANATVSMTGPNGNVPLNIVSRTEIGFGDNTIVWEPQGIDNTNTEDIPYVVTISGIAGTPQTSYTYTATLFDPTQNGGGNGGGNGGNCMANEIVSTATINGTTAASASIVTQGTVTTNGSTIFSAPMVTLNAGFTATAANMFEVNTTGCAGDGGGGGMADGTCAAPYVLTCGTNFTGTTIGGPSNWDTYLDQFGNTGPEKIHTLTIPAGATRTITLGGFTGDLDIYVSTTCSNTTSVGGATLNNPEIITLTNDAPNASTYYLIVDGWSGASSAYTLSCANMLTGREIEPTNRIGTAVKPSNSSYSLVEKTGVQANLAVYPNPSASTTIIEYQLLKAGKINLYVNDLMGKRIAIMADEQYLEKGTHRFQFDAAILQNGIYYITLMDKGQLVTKKLIVNK